MGITSAQIILFVMTIVGLLAHAFKKTYERNKAQQPKYNIGHYFRDEMNGICCNLLCQMMIAYYSGGLKQIQQLPEYVIGPLYFGIGYMGDSVFPSLLELIPMAVDKFKALLGFKKTTVTPPNGGLSNSNNDEKTGG